MMSDEQAFLNALTANPADDVCRLAYSDWLEERNEIGKATYLRLVVRAVEQITNGEDLGTTRDGLWPLITTLEEDWRNAVGRRFDVRLEGYEALQKISTITALRELFDWGLAKAKEASEKLPNELTGGCQLEDALAIQTRLLQLPSVQVLLIAAVASRLPPKLPLDLHRIRRLVVVLEPFSYDAEDDDAAAYAARYLDYLPAFRSFMQQIDKNVIVEPQVDWGRLAATFPLVGPMWFLRHSRLQLEERMKAFVLPERYFVMVIHPPDRNDLEGD